jgi:3-deoxy-manno-octulosonate cytidylyltransferase (CMP-KDO synthetase)
MIAGVPMVVRVARQTEKALGKTNTWIATDDERIAATCRDYGFQSVMTSSRCKTGTDRLAEFSEKIQADVYINIQGDEPVIDPADIEKVVRAKRAHYDKVVNGMCGLLPHESPGNINIPKVVTAADGRLLYMSRLPVPGIKDPKTGAPAYKKQVCIYAFTKEELAVYGSYTQKAECELYEDIEILRFLDAGISVLMVETSGYSMAVDTPEDVALVEAFLQQNRITTHS